MKKILILVIISLILPELKSQIVVETETYTVDEYIEKCTELPIVREIRGGTKFVVTYEGDWTNEMKNAFEYACKIWEETLPTALPINITAKVARIRTSGNKEVLSRVGVSTMYCSRTTYSQSNLYSQIKGVLLAEYNYAGNYQYVDSLTNSFFELPDMVLTYNSDKLDEMYFTQEAKSTDKYDFVTLVLRDIAKGMGFYSGLQKKPTKNQLDIVERDLLPLGKYLCENYLSYDSVSAYNNATQGTLPVNLVGYGVVQMYAPSTWTNDVSLNYFVPDSTKKITELLSCDFGKGYVIRDIFQDYSSLFRNVLGWKVVIPTGGTPDINTDVPYSTGNVVAYNGDIVIREIPDVGEISLHEDMAGIMVINNLEEPEDDYVNWDELFAKYDCSLNMSGDIMSYGWAVALLKKDGTWDVVKDYNYTPYTISTEEFELHCDASEYARTCDGYLRARITFTDGRESDATYYVLDYLPQKVEMDLIGVVSSSSYSARAVTDDEYMRDIKIGIKNLEGADRVVVQQHDEWDRVPFRYELSDFKDGYFIATVDKEFYSEFTVTAYNENGSTVSDVFVVEPLEPAEEMLDADVSDSYITLKSNYRRGNAESLVESYNISSLDSYNVRNIAQNVTSIDNDRIDISSLASGLYVLSVTDRYGNRHVVKFVKQ